MIAPVQLSDEELLARMKRGTRYNTRRAQRMGVTVRSGTIDDVNDFYELYADTAKVHGFIKFPRQYIRYLMQLFNEHNRLHMLIAEHGDRIVGARSLAIVRTVGYGAWSATHRGEEERKFKAGDLLQFHAMRLLRSLGCECLDYGGTEPYKRHFSQNVIEWPLPLRKFYGPVSGLRRILFERSSSNSMLYRMCHKAIRYWELRPKMPY